MRRHLKPITQQCWLDSGVLEFCLFLSPPPEATLLLLPSAFGAAGSEDVLYQLDGSSDCEHNEETVQPHPPGPSSWLGSCWLNCDEGRVRNRVQNRVGNRLAVADVSSEGGPADVSWPPR